MNNKRLLATIVISVVVILTLCIGCASAPITITSTLNATVTTTEPAVTLTATTTSLLTTTATATLPAQTTTTTTTATVTATATATATVTSVVTITPAATIPGQISESIPPIDAFQLINNNAGNPSFIIIDVRTPAERATGFIANSILMDYNAGVFDSQVVNLSRCSTYLVYCSVGSRSLKAITEMKALYFQQVYTISGGISAWIAAGLPVTS